LIFGPRKEVFRPERQPPIALRPSRVIKDSLKTSSRLGSRIAEKSLRQGMLSSAKPSGLRARKPLAARTLRSAALISCGATLPLIMAERRFRESGFGAVRAEHFLPLRRARIHAGCISTFWRQRLNESFAAFGIRLPSFELECVILWSPKQVVSAAENSARMRFPSKRSSCPSQ